VPAHAAECHCGCRRSSAEALARAQAAARRGPEAPPVRPLTATILLVICGLLGYLGFGGWGADNVA
jgi:hypothetical protein